MYAVIDYKTWRVISDASEALPNEMVSNTLPAPTPAQAFSDYCDEIANGVTGWLSAYVNTTYNYDNIVSAASYAGDPDPTFNAEGTAAKQWRSDCFKALYAAIGTYSTQAQSQWPTLSYILSNLPQPTAYNWSP
jgi:hypothetical protein